MKRYSLLLRVVLLLATTMSAVPGAADEAPAELRRIPVTSVQAGVRNLEIWQHSLGRLQAKTAPLIAAEVGGRIISVSADVGQKVEAGQILAQIDDTDFRLAKQLVSSDIARLQALIKAQQLQVKRFQKLVQNNSANQSSLDNAEAQLGSLQAQLVGARVRLQQAQRSISKTRIISPQSGRIDERRISVGDYLKAGTPLFKITALDILQAHLPFPEALASQLHVGQLVRLSTPVSPGSVVESRVSQIRPQISASNLAIELLVDVDNKNGWEPGASVSAEVLVAQHKNAVVVPSGCVVRRPSGLVVYKIVNDKAIETTVTTGLIQHGETEILSGVQSTDRLALDGAPYLADGVAVKVKSTMAQGGAQ